MRTTLSTVLNMENETRMSLYYVNYFPCSYSTRHTTAMTLMTFFCLIHLRLRIFNHTNKTLWWQQMAIEAVSPTQGRPMGRLKHEMECMPRLWALKKSRRLYFLNMTTPDVRVTSLSEERPYFQLGAPSTIYDYSRYCAQPEASPHHLLYTLIWGFTTMLWLPNPKR